MKISNLVEQIFSIAVALDQNGTMKNTIYAIDNEVFIMNYDHTVLIRFELRKSETPFKSPISFKANDYDSNNFEEKKGRIIFHSMNGIYSRSKSCGTADLTAEEVKELFESYPIKKSTKNSKAEITLNTDILELLDTNLSHIEFAGKKGSNLVLTQRNIYSGGKVEIRKKEEGFFKETLTKTIPPMAMKTVDFTAMFSFQDSLKFTFPDLKNDDYFVIQNVGNKRSMTALIAGCIYDEIIKLRTSKK